MNKDYIFKTKKFIEEIKQEKEYTDYTNYRDIISKDERLARKLEEYMKIRFDLQANNPYGTYSSYENLINLQNEYDNFLSEPLVQNFLKAELKYSKLISSIFEIISEDVDFNLEFLN